jgi:hypothetical protein
MKRTGRVGAALVALLVLAASAAASSSATPATPVLQQSAVITRAGGHVTFERPGSSTFATLGSASATIPFGTTINADQGKVKVTIATAAPGTPATALFYSGEFSISQAATSIATLTLDAPLQGCTNAGATGPSGTTGPTAGPLARIASKAHASPVKKVKTRSLWGDGGSGQFTTKGNYAAATVLGTIWLTTDSCTNTVVAVAEGEVSVTNLVTTTTSNVTSGQAVAVASTGTATSEPFSGALANGYAVTIAASSPTVTLKHDYSLTATGTAGGSGSAYVYENLGVKCSSTLASEQSNSNAYEFKSETLTAAGPFTLVAPAYARHTGTKYYCAYLTNPAAYAQVVVHVVSQAGGVRDGRRQEPG